jgi:hypothetical protein
MGIMGIKGNVGNRHFENENTGKRGEIYSQMWTHVWNTIPKGFNFLWEKLNLFDYIIGIHEGIVSTFLSY